MHLEESFSPSTSDSTNYNDMPMLTFQEEDATDDENNSEELPLTANDITKNIILPMPEKEQINF